MAQLADGSGSRPTICVQQFDGEFELNGPCAVWGGEYPGVRSKNDAAIGECENTSCPNYI